MLVPIRPGDPAYVNNDGSIFHPQDENNNLNVAYYEIQAEADTIDFDVADNAQGLSEPVLVLYSTWGTVDFTLLDRNSGDPIVSELSGFDTDVWIVNLSGTSGRLRLTDFDTDAGVDGQQAAWLPFVEVRGLES